MSEHSFSGLKETKALIKAIWEALGTPTTPASELRRGELLGC